MEEQKSFEIGDTVENENGTQAVVIAQYEKHYDAVFKNRNVEKVSEKDGWRLKDSDSAFRDKYNGILEKIRRLNDQKHKMVREKLKEL